MGSPPGREPSERFLAAALGDLRDCGFGNFKLRIRRPNRDGLVLYRDDGGDNAAIREDSVAGFDRFQEFSLLLLLLLLRAQQGKIKRDEHDENKPHLPE